MAGVVLSLLLLADWRSGYPLLALLTVVGFGTVGLADDLFKISGQGLSARAKLFGQLAAASLVALAAYWLERQTSDACVRGVAAGYYTFDLGAAVVGTAVLVLVGSSNAANLTDGLDGLAGGCLMLAFVTMGLVAYWAGDPDCARGLGLADAPGAGEMAVAAAGAAGALAAFLWFNCPPAKVFMGDTGAYRWARCLGSWRSWRGKNCCSRSWAGCWWSRRSAWWPKWVRFDCSDAGCCYARQRIIIFNFAAGAKAKSSPNSGSPRRSARWLAWRRLP